MLGDDLKTMLPLVNDSDLTNEDYERMLKILEQEISALEAELLQEC